MKLVVVLLAILGLSYAAPSSRSLQEDFQQITDLIPIEDILEVARRFNSEDPEFQEIVAYLQGSEWHELVHDIGDNETWQRFKKFMLENGIDIDTIIEAIHDFIEGARIPPKSKGQRSLRDFVDEVLGLINIDAILLAINELLYTSETFQGFFAVISGPESRQLIEEVRAIPEVQRIAKSLRDRQIDVDALLAFFYSLLGWN